MNSVHEIDWDNAEILDCSDFFYPRLYLESLQQWNNVESGLSLMCTEAYRFSCAFRSTIACHHQFLVASSFFLFTLMVPE